MAYGSSQARGQIGAVAMAYTTATTTQDPSCICNIHQSSWKHRILDPLSEARDRTHILMDTSWVHVPCAIKGTPPDLPLLPGAFCHGFLLSGMLSALFQILPTVQVSLSNPPRVWMISSRLWWYFHIFRTPRGWPCFLTWGSLVHQSLSWGSWLRRFLVLPQNFWFLEFPLWFSGNKPDWYPWGCRFDPRPCSVD